MIKKARLQYRDSGVLREVAPLHALLGAANMMWRLTRLVLHWYFHHVHSHAQSYSHRARVCQKIEKSAVGRLLSPW